MANRLMCACDIFDWWLVIVIVFCSYFVLSKPNVYSIFFGIWYVAARCLLYLAISQERFEISNSHMLVFM